MAAQCRLLKKESSPKWILGSYTLELTFFRGYRSRQTTSARNLKDPFLRGFSNTEQNIGKLRLLEAERGSALEIEKESALGAGNGEWWEWSEDLLTCCEFRQLKLVSRIVE